MQRRAVIKVRINIKIAVSNQPEIERCTLKSTINAVGKYTAVDNVNVCNDIKMDIW